MTSRTSHATKASNSTNPYEARLLEENGELMGAKALAALLHFQNDRSFRRAAAAGILPVSVFHLPGRKGWYARTREVAAWLLTVAEAKVLVRASPTTCIQHSTSGKGEY